jgi:hypothetical protein
MHTLDANLWDWKTRPTTDAEFEAMMVSLDAFLAAREVLPHQRSFAGKALVARTLHLSAPLMGSILGIGADESDPTLKRVSEWFQAVYKKRFNPHFDARSFAFDLRGTLWRMNVGVIFGAPPIFLDKDWSNTGGQPIKRSLNLIHGIEDFTPASAASLSLAEFDAIDASIRLGVPALNAMDDFTGHTMFDLARLDFAHSVDALISGIAWSKAWWETAQTAEKIMKCLLKMENHPDLDRKKGHIIPYVGRAFGDHFAVTLPADLLQAIDCKADVRYGDVEATREDAFAAHVALLKLVPLLAEAYNNRPRRSP